MVEAVVKQIMGNVRKWRECRDAKEQLLNLVAETDICSNVNVAFCTFRCG